MTKTKLKRGDMVRVVAGKDVGREGRILLLDRAKNKVVVEGLNLQTKHQRSNRTNQTGGISRKEAPLAISNVMYLHKGNITRLGYKLEVSESGGKKVTTKRRFAKSTGELVD